MRQADWRMLYLTINNRIIAFQASPDACVRFGHLEFKKVNDGVQILIQNWDKALLERKAQKRVMYSARNLFT